MAWSGLASAPDPQSSLLALLFENGRCGLKIFRGLHDELGDVDEVMG